LRRFVIQECGIQSRRDRNRHEGEGGSQFRSLKSKGFTIGVLFRG
jgi:hypothetical protein